MTARPLADPRVGPLFMAWTRAAAAVVAAGFMTVPIAEAAPDRPPTDRVGAPYFVVESERGTTEALPLAATRADVRVAGTIAHVRVEQVYRNRGTSPLEATYVFPGSTRAAVFAMRMKIGERTIEAKIQTKDDARQTYARAKAEGRSASLLEQHRPNVFQMKVANIMPGDRIQVELDYVEMLVPDAGTYELVIPAVVGPRYEGEAAPTATTAGSESWLANPYLTGGPGGERRPPYDWGVNLKIKAAMPIAGLQSPSHRVSPKFDGPSAASVTTTDPAGGDRDFVVRYRLDGEKIQSGVLLFPGSDGEENFFAMMMTPPRRPKTSRFPPREYIFVVDISGSMRGFPLDVSKRLIRRLLDRLRPQDRFNILLFAGSNRVFEERSVRATPANTQRALEMIDRQRGGGGTRLLAAMKRALALPRADDMSTSLVVITDGYVSVEREAFSLVRKSLDRANLFAFGIGRSVNRYLIEGLARSGMGEPFVVLDPAAAPEQADAFLRYIESPVLTDIGVAFDGFKAYDVEPATMPDLFAERPVLVFGKYRGPAKGRIIVEGRNANGRFRNTLDVSRSVRDRGLVALKYLWARHRVADLADYERLARDASVVKEITELGLKYSLMTDHTSFVAVDSAVRNTGGHADSVVQPLPLPKDVPQTAGASFATVPQSRRTVMRRARPYKQSDKAIVGSAPATGVRPEALAPEPSRPRPARAAAGEDLDQTRDVATGVGGRARRASPHRAAIAKVRAAIRKCFVEQGVDPKDAVATVAVGADGRVVRVTWKRALHRPKLEQCVDKVMRDVQLVAIGRPYVLEVSIADDG